MAQASCDSARSTFTTSVPDCLPWRLKEDGPFFCVSIRLFLAGTLAIFRKSKYVVVADAYAGKPSGLRKLRPGSIVAAAMKIVVLSVGRVRQQFIKDGELEYLKRLKGGFQVEVQELGLEAPESMSPQQVQEREALEVLKRIKPGEFVVALDERGKTATSKELSALCAARMNAGAKVLWFVIGGAYGFAEKVRQRADYVLSLSALTMPHQLARLEIGRAHV